MERVGQQEALKLVVRKEDIIVHPIMTYVLHIVPLVEILHIVVVLVVIVVQVVH
jgi:hypothetical protein